MTTVGIYYHDFPRLAKESGYFFQENRGKVNWSEIEHLKVEDIIEKRNFQLLEKSLLNVINCDLKREYDFEMFDQKFIKLFKLSQLGVDYLSYCVMYLDRCVVLLQEQLINCQEKCEELKKVNERKTEDLKKCKKKNKTQNFQCELCNKVFISETYLKFHYKRRHSVLNTTKSSDGEIKKAINAYQQTNENEKVTKSTQTSLTNDVGVNFQEINEIDKNKEIHNEKIEHFQKELEDLKIRIKETENTLSEKKGIPKSPDLPYMNFAAPVFYPFAEPFPSHHLQSLCYFYQKNAGYLPTNSETYQSIPLSEPQIQNIEHEKVKTSTSSIKNPIEDVKQEKASKTFNSNENSDILRAVEENFCKKYDTKSQKKLTFNKENINPETPSKVVTGNISKSFVLPSTSENFRVIKDKEEVTATESLLDINTKKFVQSESSRTSIVSGDTIVSCIELQEKLQDETPLEILKESKENLMKFKETQISSNECFSEQKVTYEQNKGKSSMYNIIEHYPKLHNFGKNFRRSFTNLCESVFTGGTQNTQDTRDRTTLNFQTDELEYQLKKLGIDPSWSGIPKNTMELKLTALKHRQKLLAMENPKYLVIRKSLQKIIFKKLKKEIEKKCFSNKECTNGSNFRNSVHDNNKKLNMFKKDTDSED